MEKLSSLSEAQKLGVCVLSGTFCALTALFVRSRLQEPRPKYREQTITEFANTHWNSFSADELQREVLKVILGQPGLFFGGIDPTFPNDNKLTEEYQNCLIARIRQVTSEKYFVPENILVSFDRQKTEKELQVAHQENSIDLTS